MGAGSAFAGWVARFALQLGALAVALAAAAAPVSAQVTVPDSDREWDVLEGSLERMLEGRDYFSLLDVWKVAGPALAAKKKGHRSASICIARGLVELNLFRESLPHYERALRLRATKDDAVDYLRMAHRVGRALEASKIVSRLRLPAEDRVAVAAVDALFREVEKGDRQFMKGKRPKALSHYEKALKHYESIPADAKRQERFWKPRQELISEHTVQRLYDKPDGHRHHDFLVATFLRKKLDLCRAAPVESPKAVFRVAAIIVPKIDVKYDDDGFVRHDVRQLSKDELEVYKRAWTFAAAAVAHHAKGALAIETEWLEAKRATLTGLVEDNWRGVLKRRRLDIEKLTPRPDKLFARAAAEFDGVIFVWPRGHAAKTDGGGPLHLPLAAGPGPEQAGVRNVPRTAAACLRAFLRNFERGTLSAPVDGPKGGWTPPAEPPTVTDEVDWYAWLIEHAKDWPVAKFRK